MSDKDIELHIKTTGDPSGVDKVQERLTAMDEARRKAAEESIQAGDDEAKAARRLEYELGKVAAAYEKLPDKVTTGFGGMLDATVQETEAVRELGRASDTTVKHLDDLLQKVEEVSKKSDEAGRKAGKTGGLFGVDVTGPADKVLSGAASAAGYGAELEAIKGLSRGAAGGIAADAAVIGGAFVAAGAAAVKSYQTMAQAVTGFKQLMADAKAQGEDMGPELEDQVVALEATLAPLSGVLETITDKVSGFWQAVTNPVDTFTGLGALRQSLEGQREAAEKLAEARRKIAAENESGLSTIYANELKALREQESTMQRIARLRSEMANLEIAGAQQEVQSAKLRGGDVGLAEANALAVQIRAGTEKLTETLRGTKANADIAEREYNAALGTYQQAIRDKVNELDPGRFSALSQAVDEKKAAFDTANAAVNDQAAIFQEARNNLLRGAENQLAALEQEYAEKASPAAKQAFDSIYQGFKDAVSQGPQQVIESIKVDVDAVTNAANAKADEVSGGMVRAAQNIDATFNRLSGNVDSLITMGRNLTGIVERQSGEIDALNQRIQTLSMRW